MKRKVLFGLLSAAALFVAVPIALAGGWAVVSLDALPTGVAAGQPVTIGFRVLQHGRQPLAGLAPQVLAWRQDTGEAFEVAAIEAGPAGHYQAALIFPSAGRWEWAIRNGFGAFNDAGLKGQPMPALEVQGETSAPVAAAAPRPNRPARPAPMLPLAAIATGLGVGVGVAAWARTRGPWAAAATLAALMAGALSLVLMSGPAAADPVAVYGEGATPAETGEALFLAKGCVMCHQHAAVAGARAYLGDFVVGPNLTQISAPPAYLRQWLRNPSSIRPATDMPNLGLSDAEVEALVAFLNSPAN